MLAILDSRMKIVAHERFQYVLLKKFGKLPTTTFLEIFYHHTYHHRFIENDQSTD